MKERKRSSGRTGKIAYALDLGRSTGRGRVPPPRAGSPCHFLLRRRRRLAGLLVIRPVIRLDLAEPDVAEADRVAVLVQLDGAPGAAGLVVVAEVAVGGGA